MNSRHRNARATGFTLVELLAVLTIIALLTGMMASAVMKSYAIAAEAKTKAVITKLNNKVMYVWEQYRYRRIPISPDATKAAAAKGPQRTNGLSNRLKAMYETQRLELPHRWTDICAIGSGSNAGGYVQDESVLAQRPAMHVAYLMKTAYNKPGLKDTHQSAECLYLILTTGLGSDGLDESSLTQASTADTDQDGWPEFIDGFGQPLQFYRWPSGFISDLQPLGPNGRWVRDDSTQANPLPWNPSPFNPLGLPMAGLSTNDYSQDWNFALTPLIISAGPDQIFALMNIDSAGRSYSWLCNPYPDVDILPAAPEGFDYTRDEEFNPELYSGFRDNIHSHQLGIR